MQNKLNPNLDSTVRSQEFLQGSSPKISDFREGQSFAQLQTDDLRQLSFFRDEAFPSMGLVRGEARYEYREMDSVPVKEVNELEQLRSQVEALKDTSERLKFIIGEVQYLLRP